MKKYLRQLRLFLGKLLLDKKTTDEKVASNYKIIVLQQDGKIGDYIVSSFIFRELKRQYPNSQIDILCSVNNVELFQQNKFVDNCYQIKKRTMFSYFKTAKSLRKNNYDFCINLPIMIRNRDLLLTRVINAKNNIGYLKQSYNLFNLNINNPTLHFSQVYAKAIELCGVKNINTQYDIPQTNKQTNKQTNIHCFIEQNQLHQCIAINFFGAARTRKLSENKIIQLLNHIKKIAPQRKIILLTYPAVTNQLKNISKFYENVFVYDETKSIFDTISLIENAEWVISPDTSIIHIAVGLNKKIVGFYRTIDKENNHHWAPNSTNECHIIGFNHHIDEINETEIKKEWFNLNEKSISYSQ